MVGETPAQGMRTYTRPSEAKKAPKSPPEQLDRVLVPFEVQVAVFRDPVAPQVAGLIFRFIRIFFITFSPYKPGPPARFSQPFEDKHLLKLFPPFPPDATSLPSSA